MLYRRKVVALRDALADLEIRDEALDALRGLVERIIIHPLDQGHEIELIGEIANMKEIA